MPRLTIAALALTALTACASAQTAPDVPLQECKPAADFLRVLAADGVDFRRVTGEAQRRAVGFFNNVPPASDFAFDTVFVASLGERDGGVFLFGFRETVCVAWHLEARDWLRAQIAIFGIGA